MINFLFNKKILMFSIMIFLILIINSINAKANYFKPAIGEVDFAARANLKESADGREIIISGNDGKLYIFKSDRTLLSSDWPKDFIDEEIITSPLLYDIDRNGESEVAIGTRDNTGNYKLYLLNKDATENVQITLSSLYNIGSDIEIVDFNNDSIPEWIVPDKTGCINVFNNDGSLFGSIIIDADTEQCFIETYDIDGDSIEEIIVSSTAGKIDIMKYTLGSGFASISNYPLLFSDNQFFNPGIIIDAAGDLKLVVVSYEKNAKIISINTGDVDHAYTLNNLDNIISGSGYGNYDSDIELELVFVDVNNKAIICDIDGTTIKEIKSLNKKIKSSIAGKDWSGNNNNEIFNAIDNSLIWLYLYDNDDISFKKEKWGKYSHLLGIKVYDETPHNSRYFSPDGNGIKDNVELGYFRTYKEKDDNSIICSKLKIYDVNMALVKVIPQENTDGKGSSHISSVEWDGFADSTYLAGAYTTVPVPDGEYKYLYEVSTKDDLEYKNLNGFIYIDTSSPLIDITIEDPLFLPEDTSGDYPTETKLNVIVSDENEILDLIKVEVIDIKTDIIVKTLIQSQVDLDYNDLSGLFEKEIEFIWDGKNNSFIYVSPGVYKYKITCIDISGNEVFNEFTDKLVFVYSTGTEIDKGSLYAIPFIFDPNSSEKNNTTLFFKIKNDFLEYTDGNLNGLSPDLYKVDINVNIYGEHLEYNTNTSSYDTVVHDIDLLSINDFNLNQASTTVGALEYDGNCGFSINWDGKDDNEIVMPDSYKFSLSISDNFGFSDTFNAECIVAYTAPEITAIIDENNGYFRITGRANRINGFSGYEMFYSSDDGDTWKPLAVPVEYQDKNHTDFSDSNLSIKQVTGSIDGISSGTLAIWNTFGLPAGDYKIKLHVIDEPPSSDVINDIAISNSPMIRNFFSELDAISPNGDGIKDSTKLFFTVSKELHNVEVVIRNKFGIEQGRTNLGTISNSEYPYTEEVIFTGNINGNFLDGLHSFDIESSDVNFNNPIEIYISQTITSSANINIDPISVDGDGSVISENGYLYTWEATGKGVQTPLFEVDCELDVYGKQSIVQYPLVPVELLGIEEYEDINLSGGSFSFSVMMHFWGDDSGTISKSYSTGPGYEFNIRNVLLNYLPIRYSFELNSSDFGFRSDKNIHKESIDVYNCSLSKGGYNYIGLFDVNWGSLFTDCSESNPNWCGGEKVKIDIELKFSESVKKQLAELDSNTFYYSSQDRSVKLSKRDLILSGDNYIKVYFDNLKDNISNKIRYILENWKFNLVVKYPSFYVYDYFTGNKIIYSSKDWINIVDINQANVIKIDEDGNRYIEVDVSFQYSDYFPWPLKNEQEFYTVVPYGIYDNLDLSQDNDINFSVQFRKDNSFTINSIRDIEISGNNLTIDSNITELFPQLDIVQIRMYDSFNNLISSGPDLISDIYYNVNPINGSDDYEIVFNTSKEIDWESDGFIRSGICFIKQNENTKVDNINLMGINDGAINKGYSIPSDVNFSRWNVFVKDVSGKINSSAELESIDNDDHEITIKNIGNNENVRKILELTGNIEMNNFEYYTIEIGKKDESGTNYDWWEKQQISEFGDIYRGKTVIINDTIAYLDITDISDGNYTLLLSVKGDDYVEKSIDFKVGKPIIMENLNLSTILSDPVTSFDPEQESLIIEFDLSENTIFKAGIESGVKIEIKQSETVHKTIIADGKLGHNIIEWDGKGDIDPSQYLEFGDYIIKITAYNYNGGFSPCIEEKPIELEDLSLDITGIISAVPDKIILGSPVSGKNKTRIYYTNNEELSDTETCAVKIMDGTNLIRSINGTKYRGGNYVIWDGKNDNLSDVSNGIYDVVIELGGSISPPIVKQVNDLIEVYNYTNDSNPIAIIDISEADNEDCTDGDSSCMNNNVIPGKNGTYFNWKAKLSGKKSKRQAFNSLITAEGIKYHDMDFDWTAYATGLGTTNTHLDTSWITFGRYDTSIKDGWLYSGYFVSTHDQRMCVYLRWYNNDIEDWKDEKSGCYSILSNDKIELFVDLTHSGDDRTSKLKIVRNGNFWFELSTTQSQFDNDGAHGYIYYKERMYFANTFVVNGTNYGNGKIVYENVYKKNEWNLKDSLNNNVTKFQISEDEWLWDHSSAGSIKDILIKNVDLSVQAICSNSIGDSDIDEIIDQDHANLLINYNIIGSNSFNVYRDDSTFDITWNSTVSWNSYTTALDVPVKSIILLDRSADMDDSNPDRVAIFGKNHIPNTIYPEEFEIISVDNSEVNMNFNSGGTILETSGRDDPILDNLIVEAIVTTPPVDWSSTNESRLVSTEGHFTGDEILTVDGSLIKIIDIFNQNKNGIGGFPFNPEGANKDYEIRVETIDIELFKYKDGVPETISLMNDRISEKNDDEVNILDDDNIIIDEDDSWDSAMEINDRYENFNVGVNEALARKYIIVNGTASDSYTLEYGKGANPSEWFPISSGPGPITDDELGKWDISSHSGVYTLLLTVSDGSDIEIAKKTFQIGNYIDGSSLIVIDSPYGKTKMIIPTDGLINGDEVYIKESASHTTAIDEVVYGAYDKTQLPEKDYLGSTYSESDLNSFCSIERTYLGNEGGVTTSSLENINLTFSRSGFVGVTPGYSDATIDIDSSHVLINEIYFGNENFVDDGCEKYSEYIELYNPTDDDIPLSGYIIGDGEGEGQIPSGIIIKASGNADGKDFLVIARDADAYYEKFNKYPDLEWDAIQYDGDNNSDIPDIIHFNDSKPIISMEMDNRGNDVLSIIRKLPYEYIDKPYGKYLVDDIVYDFKPDGLRFNKNMSPLLLYFGKLDELPQSVNPETLRLAFLDDKDEVKPLDSSYVSIYDSDTPSDGVLDSYCVSAEINHFSEYSIIATLQKPSKPVLTTYDQVVNVIRKDIAGNADIDTDAILFKGNQIIAQVQVQPEGNFIFENILLEEGENKINVISENIFKDKSELSDDLFITYDIVNPELLSKSITHESFSPNNDGIKDNAIIEFIFSEEVIVDFSLYNSTEKELYSVKNYDVTEENGNYIYSVVIDRGNIQNADEGILTFRISGSDKAGNNLIDDQSLRGQIKLDITIPEVKLISKTDSFSPNKDGAFEFAEAIISSSDNLSESISLKGVISKDNIEIANIIDDNVISSGTKKCIWDGKDYKSMLMPDGIYQLKIVAIDEAGNKNENFTTDFIIDTTPPDGLNNFTLDKVYYNNNDIINYSYDILEECFVNTSIYFNDNLINNLILHDLQTPNNYQINENINLSDGNYIFKISIEDEVSNINKKQQIFIVDSESPLINIDESFLSIINENNIEINGSITDSNIKQIEIFYKKIESSEFILLNMINKRIFENETIYNWNIANLNGIHELKIVAEDEAGNISDKYIKPIEIKKYNKFLINYKNQYIVNSLTLMQFPIAAASNLVLSANVTNGEGFNREILTTEYENGYYYILWDYNDNYGDSVEDGNYKIVFNIVNPEFMDDVEIRTINILIDTGIPVISLNDLFDGKIINGDLSINGTISDENLSYFKIEYRSPDGSWNIIMNGFENISNSHITDWCTKDLQGTYYLKVSAYDVAGNYNVEMISVFIENEVPLIQITQPEYLSYYNNSININGSFYGDICNFKYGKGNNPDSYNLIGSINNSVKNSLLYSWDISLLSDGLYTLVAGASKNSYEKEVKKLLYIDNTAPVILLDKDSLTGIFFKEILLTGSVDDDNLESYAISYRKKNDIEWIKIYKTSQKVIDGLIYKFDSSDLYGIYEIKIAAIDYSGNITEDVVSVNIDNKNPVANINYPAGYEYYGGEISIIGSASSGRFDKYELYYKDLNNATWNLLNENDEEKTDALLGKLDTLANNVKDGLCYIKLIVFDSVGNYSEDTVSVYIDNVVPDIIDFKCNPIAFNPHKSVNNATLIYYEISKPCFVDISSKKDNITVSDIINNYYSQDLEKYSVWEGKNNSRQIVQDDKYDIILNIKDYVGNEIEKICEVTVDTINPDIDISFIDNYISDYNYISKYSKIVFSVNDHNGSGTKEIKFKIADDGPWKSYLIPFSLTSKYADLDNFEIKFYTIDNAGNKSSLELSSGIVMDIIPPDTLVTGHNHFYQREIDGVNYFFNNSLLEIELNSTDDKSGVEKILIGMDNINFNKYETPVSFEDENIYEIYYYAIDNVLNEENVRKAVVVIDKTLPVITDISINEDPYIPFIGDAVFSFDINEESFVTLNILNKNNEYLYTVTENQIFNSGTNSIVWNGRFGTEIIPAGNYNFKIIVTDLAGNSLVGTGSFEVIWDIQPPRTSISVGVPQYSNEPVYVTSGTPFTLTAVDDLVEVFDGIGLGVENTYYNISDSEDIIYANAFTVLQEGLQKINYYSVDTIGNTETNQILNIGVDNTPPVTSISIGEPKWEYGGNLYITSHSYVTLHVFDPEINGAASGINNTEYKINGGSWIDYTVLYTVNGDDGDYSIYYRSIDNVENLELSNEQKIILDNTPPEIPLDLIAYIENATNVSLFWSDVTIFDLAGYNLYDNGVKVNSGLITQSSIYLYGVEQGSHSYTITSVDMLGNESDASEVFSLVQDNTIKITSPKVGEYYRKMLKIVSEINLSKSKHKHKWGRYWNKQKSQLTIEYGEGKNPESWVTIKKFKNWPGSKHMLLFPWKLWEKYKRCWKPLNGEYRLRIKIVNKDGYREDTRVVWVDNKEPETTIMNIAREENNKLYLESNELLFDANDPEINGIASGINYTKYRLIEIKHLHNYNFCKSWKKYKYKLHCKWWHKNDGEEFENESEKQLYGYSGWKKWDGNAVNLEKGKYYVWYFSADNAKMWMNDNKHFKGNEETINFNVIVITNEQKYDSIPAPIVYDDEKNDDNPTIDDKEPDNEPKIIIVIKDNTNTKAEEDTDPPEINITGIENNGVYNEDKKAIITIIDENEMNYIITLNKFPYNGQLITMDDDYELYVHVVDSSGNSSATNVKFIIDKTLPDINITGVENDTYYNKNVTIDVDITDDNLKESNISLNGTPFVSGHTVTEEREHNLTAIAEDKAGNTVNENINFSIDKQSPLININGVVEDGVYDKTSPKIDVIDEEISKVSIKLNDNIIKSADDINSGTYSVELDEIDKEGDYALNVEAEDRAQNIEQATVNFRIESLEKYLVFYSSFDESCYADKHGGDNTPYVKDCIINKEDENGILSEECIGIRYNSFRNINATNGTVMMKVKPEWKNLNNVHYLFSHIDDNPNKFKSIKMSLSVSSDNELELIINTCNTNHSLVISSGNEKWYDSKEWTDIAFSWNSKTGKVKIYINGEIKGTLNVQSWAVPKHNYIWVGNIHNDNSRNSEVKIDEFRIYNKMLNNNMIKSISSGLH